MGIFLDGEDSRGDHGLGRLVEFRFKAPPGTTSPSITTHTPSGQRVCASWASQPQKSVTLLPCPGGRTTKSTKDMWWHWTKKSFLRTNSDNERNQLYLGFRRRTSSYIYIAYLSFQRPSLRMLPYCSERTHLHCPNYRSCPLRHCQFSTDATSCGLQFISFALHYRTIILLWTLTWHANLNVESQNSIQSNATE